MRPTLLLTALLLPCIAHAQWEIQIAPTTASLRGIHSVGNGIAWASGSSGTVLRTIDDGKTWQLCATPPNAEKLDFRGIQAFDANAAIVMSSGKGDLSRLYKTIDACRTWTLLFTNPDPDGRNWRALRPTPTEPPDADKNWNALSLPFVVGPRGRIGKLRPTALTSTPEAKP